METRVTLPQGNRVFTIVIKRSGEQFVTLCLELGVAGTGDTRDEALENTRDAIESYLEAMDADGLAPERAVPLEQLHEFLADERVITRSTGVG